MAAILFPTSPGKIPSGQPLEARPCTCGDRRMFDGFTCTRCGFHLLAQIRETFATAAQRMARKPPSVSRLKKAAT